MFSFLGFLGLSVPDFMLSLMWLVFATMILGISASFLKPLSDKGFKGGGEEQNRGVLKALQDKGFRVF